MSLTNENVRIYSKNSTDLGLGIICTI